MNKNGIKKFAIEARRELIARVSQRALFFGITEETMGSESDDVVNGRVLSAVEKAERAALIRRIRAKGYREVMEEAAYTWFNRFIALRFMEVNDYLPGHIRVFTDEENRMKPQILTEALDLDLDGLDMEKVAACKEANDDEGLYKYLLITVCNALSSLLPGMFQKIADYTELLFPENLLREGSVIAEMIRQIPAEDWKDAVQIIGWLYQYYNSEKKDEVFAALKKNVKVTKENIPAATQLFTPDWIVRYMVENSLGRLWLEGHEEKKADFLPTAEEQAAYAQGERSEEDRKWHYYLEEAPQDEAVEEKLAALRAEQAHLSPEDILCLDPCAGSGHILAYLFDALMEIYGSAGYQPREAAQLIAEKNIYGLDIDDRAAQLAYFSVMMKGRQYDRRFLTRGIRPHVVAIQESNGLSPALMEEFSGGDEKLKADMQAICAEMKDAKEYGSIITTTERDWDALYARFEEIEGESAVSLYREDLLTLRPLVESAHLLSQTYHVVVTNPPYMGSGNMNEKLSDFVKKNYPDSKSDLFAVFIERCGQLTKGNGYQAMITQHAWMFLSSFEKLRDKLLQTDIVNMAHLGARAFDEIGGEVVQTSSFVVRKIHVADYKGTYCRLIEPTSQQGKEDMFLAGENRCVADQSNFSKIPGAPVAYWVSNIVSTIYGENPILGKLADVRHGLSTGKNEMFVRLWEEVAWPKIDTRITNREQIANSVGKWFPYNKGGEFRKWYGNANYVLWYNLEGQKKMASMSGHRHDGKERYFQEGITWSFISSSNFGVRYTPQGFAFDVAGSSMFLDCNIIKYVTGLLCSCLGTFFMSIQNPTLNFQVGNLKNIPIIFDKQSEVEEKVDTCIDASKQDWDSYETSWDFQKHPLLGRGLISEAYGAWKAECEARFQKLKANEEELNRIFIDIYGLLEELTPEVAEKDVTVHRIFDTKEEVPEGMRGSAYVRTLRDEVVSLISYAVGCLFGRYSLDASGLTYAGGTWDALKYGSFPADEDNIIPICDDAYFPDDMAGRFVHFLEVVYGKESLTENLAFIARALGGKGQPKEVIRKYFLDDFYKDHCKTYQKRPIYWLFDSGKKNGFKCLIYMHRYRPDTLARIRTDYVHEQQSRYRAALAELDRRMAEAPAAEKVRLGKKRKALADQAEEILRYEEKIHHLADQMISIDLDDGVKRNYEKFQDVLAKIK